MAVATAALTFKLQVPMGTTLQSTPEVISVLTFLFLCATLVWLIRNLQIITWRFE